MVALQHLAEPPAPPDVDTARAEVERLQAGLPLTLLATRPEDVRRIARQALDAEKAALRRRSRIGPEPLLDDDLATAAVAAHEAVLRAREGLSTAGAESMRWLALGNAWGVVGLGLAGGLVALGGVEPMSTAVYNAVAGAAAGPLATVVLGLSRRSLASLRLGVATAAWTRSLADAGFDTMGELLARRVAWRGWQRRSEEAAIANAAARDARAAWHRVAGPHHHPREAPQLVARLAELRAAQLDLLRALLAERARPPAPVVPLEVVPFELKWAPHPNRFVTWLRTAGVRFQVAKRAR